MNFTIYKETDMTGATGSANGVHGLVPTPSAGDQDKFLRGDGTWATSVSTKILRISATIAANAWAGQGPYTYTISNQNIESGMEVIEAWLSDESAQLGPTTYTCGNGSLAISTTEKPTASWTLTVVIGELYN